MIVVHLLEDLEPRNAAVHAWHVYCDLLRPPHGKLDGLLWSRHATSRFFEVCLHLLCAKRSSETIKQELLLSFHLLV